MAITDTSGNEITYLPLTVDSDQVSQVIAIQIDCLAGKWLAVDAADDAQVLARRTGSGDAFVDLAISPVSLTPFDGQKVSFDLKVQAGNVAGLERLALTIRVTYQP